MTRAMTRLVLAALAATAFTLVPAAPATATVHEIVAQWCSGQGELFPPGLSRDGSKNFAQPLNASGFIQGVVEFQDGFLVVFNFDNPNAKTVGSGVFVPVGELDGKPLYINVPVPNPDFPAFQHCPKLASP